MVKRSRAQSQEAPRRLSWRMMVPPDSSFHSQTRSTNASRPEVVLGLALGRELRARPRIWVAMPAWSVPGSQSAL